MQEYIVTLTQNDADRENVYQSLKEHFRINAKNFGPSEAFIIVELSEVDVSSVQDMPGVNSIRQKPSLREQLKEQHEEWRKSTGIKESPVKRKTEKTGKKKQKTMFD
jgi:hypothetical protein